MSELNEIERADLCSLTIQSFNRAGSGLRTFPGLLKKVIEQRAWERRIVNGRVVELPSLRHLITAKPVDGWGEDPAQVEAVIRDDAEALAAFREAMKHQGERADLVDNVNEVMGRPDGNSRAYSLSRVQRECDPVTVDAVMAGEMSPNAALVKAGLRENRQVYLPRDPAAAAEKLRRQFGNEFVDALRRAIDGTH